MTEHHNHRRRDSHQILLKDKEQQISTHSELRAGGEVFYLHALVYTFKCGKSQI